MAQGKHKIPTLGGFKQRLDKCLTGVTILMLLWGKGLYLDFPSYLISHSTLEILSKQKECVFMSHVLFCMLPCNRPGQDAALWLSPLDLHGCH